MVESQLSSDAVQEVNICAMGTKLGTWSCVEVCNVILCLRMNDETCFLLENHCHFIEVYDDGVMIVHSRK